MELITKAPKGTNDILPKEALIWQVLESIMRSEAECSGFQEIRTPVFEHTELFERGVGDTTDVVEKQMYTFQDKGGRSVTLRPEGTAGVVRAMLESGLYNQGYPVKLYYAAPFYRYEKPQTGRLREFRQFGIEMFGADSPSADAQVIMVGTSIFQRLGLKNIETHINSIGCPTCRKTYHDALRQYFQTHEDVLCDTCRSRLQRNPMRILDCKSPVCSKLAEDAPKIRDYICEDCSTHYAKVKKLLTSAGVHFKENDSLVRGLDYYTRTVFEFVSSEIGAQGAIGGGGRYDGLVEEIGGISASGLGFGLGMNRILLVMEKQNISFPDVDKLDLFIASIGEKAEEAAFILTSRAHKCGLIADCELCGRGLKAQLKYANKIGAGFTIVLGDDEVKSDCAYLKNMETGEKSKISLGEHFEDDLIGLITSSEVLQF